MAIGWYECGFASNVGQYGSDRAEGEGSAARATAVLVRRRLSWPGVFLLVFGCLLWPLAFALPEPGSFLLIEDVTVIDGTGRAPLPGRYVLIEGDRIAAVSGTEPDTPASTTRVDGSGKFLIPGLIDLHVHLSNAYHRTPDEQVKEPTRGVGIRDLHGFLYAGVTSIYDPGNRPDFILGLRADERAGRITAPRIFASGAMIRPAPPPGEARVPSAEYIESWPKARMAIDRVLAGNPDVVKILHDEFGWGTRAMIAAMAPDVLRRTVEYINDHGVRTTTQASHEFRAREAIYSGVDTFSHPIAQGPVSDRFVNLMAAKKVPMQSTLAIGESYSRLVEDPGYLDQPLYRAVLPAEEIARLKGPVRDHYRDRRWTWWWQVMTPVLLENVRRIHDAGGVIAMGSDQSHGPASHRELELLVKAGITPLDVIRIATFNSALWLGKEATLGTIERGKLADLVLLDADPSLDIVNARRIVHVIKAGELIDRGALELPVND